MGFIKSGSAPSLIAGGLSGLSLLFCSVLTFTYRKWGLYAAFTLMFLLDLFFSYRYLKTGAFFPAGMTLILTSVSIIALVISVIKLAKHSPSEPSH